MWGIVAALVGMWNGGPCSCPSGAVAVGVKVGTQGGICWAIGGCRNACCE